MKVNTITAGMRIWFLADQTSIPTRMIPMRVTKIGRRWAYLQNGFRFDVRTARLVGHGYCSRPPRTFDFSRYFLDRATMTDQRAVTKAWNELRRQLHDAWLVPPTLTIEQIAQARALLFDLPPVKSVRGNRSK